MKGTSVPFFNHPLLLILQKPGFSLISSSQAPGRLKTILHGTSCTLQGLLSVREGARQETGHCACKLWGTFRTGRSKAGKVTRLQIFAFHRINPQCFAHKEELIFQEYLRDNSSPLPGIDSAFARADPVIFLL